MWLHHFVSQSKGESRARSASLSDKADDVLRVFRSRQNILVTEVNAFGGGNVGWRSRKMEQWGFAPAHREQRARASFTDHGDPKRRALSAFWVPDDQNCNDVS